MSFTVAWTRRRVPYVPQMELAECGCACLLMLLHHHGAAVPLDEVRAACGASRDGVSAAALARAAAGFGLEVQGYRLPAGALGTVSLPAVAHWQGSHFVVVERVARGRVWIVDPRSGRRRLPMAAVEAAFTGIVLCMTPGAAFTPCKATGGLQRYAQALRGRGAALAALLAASLLLEGLSLAVPAATQRVVDALSTDGPLAAGIALIAGAGAGRLLLTLARDLIMNAVQMHTERALMDRVIGHLMRLPPTFLLQRAPGDLMQRAEATGDLRAALVGVVMALLDGLFVLGLAGLLLSYHAGLGLLALAVAGVRLPLLGLFSGARGDAATAEMAMRGRETGTAMDALSAPEAVRGLGLSARLTERYTDHLGDRLVAERARDRVQHVHALVLQGYDAAASALMLGLGTLAVLDGGLTLGGFGAFAAVQGMLDGPLHALATLADRIVQLRAVRARIDDILDFRPERDDGIAPVRLEGAIRLTGAGYAHAPGGPAVLSGIDLTVAPGEMVAIVGPSGAGKSTLGRLMLGLLDARAGGVSIDGRPVAAYRPEALRRRFGIVLQEPFLFDGTVRENLTLFAPGANDAALWTACRLAAVDEVVSALPQGIDTPLGEGGARLSGGQRQRLTLARALAGDPDILLLDEATSALDAATEARVHANLARIRRTRIVIAHRLATVRNADRILVLDRGVIVQRGRFAELASRPGPFRSLLEATQHASPVP
ncbi:peptidase domain-containing ABC transporter [Azospirillum canadense]|uniref:peptidase domain-containing ABC transporter n=1 Tax=Azospirillum canadense TaxID=403962 RepID=UPI002226A824|nr:peptidase domain-containing ABC transporter [Azospirillum canadense]MCW2241611.1 ABC-type bacteriocin/lantibiotic exporter with double-glycine peptidase domain [Azospirillum canadense]